VNRLSNVFTPISWQPGAVLTKSDLDKLSGNQEYLYNRMPAAAYRPGTTVISRNNIKIMAGTAILSANTKAGTAGAYVDFGSEFPSGARPIVTTGLHISNMNDAAASITIGGRRNRGIIDETGFGIYLRQTTAKRVYGGTRVHWHAIGLYQAS